MPHQRLGIITILKQKSGNKLALILKIFDTAFQMDINMRWRNVPDLLKEIDSIRNHLDDKTIPTVESTLTALEAQMRTASEQKALQLRNLLESALKNVGSVHSSLYGRFKDHLITIQGGYGLDPKASRGQNTLGYAKITDHSTRFTPTFTVEIIGSELVISATSNKNKETLFRTSTSNPTFDANFGSRTTNYFLEGITSLVATV